MNRKILFVRTGIQKEAYIFKVPYITLRETTEWVETVEDGWNVLVDANGGAIIKVANDFEPKGKQSDVFGDGKAGERVAKRIGEEKQVLRMTKQMKIEENRLAVKAQLWGK